MRTCFQKADESVQAAYDLFDLEKTSEPGQFKKAVEYLETANREIEQLRTLLGKTSSMQKAVPLKRSSIRHQINIVTAQINKRLIPSLSQNIPGRFTPLLNAMNEIKKFIPPSTNPR